MTLIIDGVSIGDAPGSYGAPCRFIAELSGNHNGSYDRAVRLIDAAKAAGADIVKFQAYTPDELVALRGDGPAPEPWGGQGFTMRALYEKNQTPLAWLPQLFQYCRDITMPAFSSVFGLDSLAMLERCACPAYKIAALDSDNDGLGMAVMSRGKPVLVSRRAGYGDRSHGFGGWKLYCPPGYPTAAADVKLPMLFGAAGFIGLSSHCMDPLLPIAAVARGANLIEMHFQLDGEPSELESAVSLTQSSFRRMVDDVRRVEGMLA